MITKKVVTKTIRIHHGEFMPPDKAHEWDLAIAWVASGSLESLSLIAPVVLPKGATITALRGRLLRVTTADIATLALWRVVGETGDEIASVTHASTGWETLAAALAQPVGEETYTLRAVLAPNLALAWVEIDYTE